MKKSGKDKIDIIVATAILLLLSASAIANTIICQKQLNKLETAVTKTECSDTESADSIRDDFEKLSFFMSITVNHDDLEDAEECVIEFLEAVEAEDAPALRLAKSRLIAALRQLGRLTGIGIDSIL